MVWAVRGAEDGPPGPPAGSRPAKPALRVVEGVPTTGIPSPGAITPA